MSSLPAADRPSFCLRERSPHVCQLAPADVAFLRTAHRDHVKLRPTGRSAHYWLTGTGHVGTIVCPSTRLIIRPKVPIADLFQLLDPGAPIASFDDEAVPEPGTEAFHFLAVRFAQLLGEHIQAGLHHGYAERQEVSAFLLGRLDVAAQVRAGGRKERLHCTHDDFTVDILCNQLAKAVALLVMRSPLLNARVAAQLQALLPPLDGVASVPLTAESFAGPLLDQAPRSYRPLLELARFLFEGLQTGTQSGAVACPAFLLNMEQVFERYVCTGVCAAFADKTRYTVALQPVHILAPPAEGQPDLRIRPDVLLSREGVLVAVLDAKWKRLAPDALRTADVYQVLAYAGSLGLRHAVLVYPGQYTRRWHYPLGRTPLQLHIYTLRVSGAALACQRGLQRFGRTLRASLRS